MINQSFTYLTGWVAQVPLWYLANNPLVIDGQ
jgi:hypothetical protein